MLFYFTYVHSIGVNRMEWVDRKDRRINNEGRNLRRRLFTRPTRRPEMVWFEFRLTLNRRLLKLIIRQLTHLSVDIEIGWSIVFIRATFDPDDRYNRIEWDVTRQTHRINSSPEITQTPRSTVHTFKTCRWCGYTKTTIVSNTKTNRWLLLSRWYNSESDVWLLSKHIREYTCVWVTY